MWNEALYMKEEIISWMLIKKNYIGRDSRKECFLTRIKLNWWQREKDIKKNFSFQFSNLWKKILWYIISTQIVMYTRIYSRFIILPLGGLSYTYIQICTVFSIVTVQICIYICKSLSCLVLKKNRGSQHFKIDNQHITQFSSLKVPLEAIFNILC